MLALSELDLLVERLRGQSGDVSAELGELARVVTERARLRRAPARAGDRVPAVGGRSPGDARGGVDVEHRELRSKCGQIDWPFRRVEHELRYLQADEVIGRAVVDGNGKVRRELVEAHATPQTFIAARAYTSAVLTSPSISRFSPLTVSRRPVDVP